MAYGVYDAPDKLQKSKEYWNVDSVANGKVETYDEALSFARDGVARLKGVSSNSLPNMQFRLNWRQKV